MWREKYKQRKKWRDIKIYLRTTLAVDRKQREINKESVKRKQNITSQKLSGYNLQEKKTIKMWCDIKI